MDSSALRRATMVGPTANCMPSSIRATRMPARKSVFIPVASSRDQKLAPGHGAVGAGGHAQLRVLKFGGDGAQQAGRDADVAVAHHHQVVARLPPACGPGCKPWRWDRAARRSRSGARTPLGYSLRSFSTTATAGSSARRDREKNLEIGVILFEKSTQVGFEIQVQAGQRFQNADRLSAASDSGGHTRR